MVEKFRILILEDSATDASLMEFELEEAGIPFVSKRVQQEKDFVQALQECSPDLVLSDYDLPQYNGLLALGEVKSRSAGTPFILVTGACDTNLAKRIVIKGANDVVMKDELYKLTPAVRQALKISTP